MSSEYNYLCKYIIIGDGGVGKSNLLLRYAHGQFNPEYQVTIGVEFGIKDVDIGNNTFRIQIWDTAGQENFKSITRSYFKNSICAIICYDITKKESFDNVTSWIEDCKTQCYKSVHMVLVGNKTDLNERRVVSTDEGKELADKLGISFYETSAKTGKNVDKVFEESLNEISKQIDQGKFDFEDECGITKGTKISNVNKKKKKKCC
jgi:small GTP-binding protein